MASPDEVKQYLAYWFQLGKPVKIRRAQDDTLLPRPVLRGDRYSPEFEVCWQYVFNHAQDCHLDGTDQTIAQLLGSAWTIHPCARCQMPVPLLDVGAIAPSCPCADLDFWPDSERPQPRGPVSSHNQLIQIRDRLLNASRRSRASSGEAK